MSALLASVEKMRAESAARGAGSGGVHSSTPRAQTDWDRVKNLIEAGYSISAAAREMDMDKGSVSRKAKENGWKKQQEKTTLIEEDVNARKASAFVAKKKQRLAPVEREIHNAVVSERMQHIKLFQNGNLLIANTMLGKVKTDGENASYQDLNAAASAVTKAQENILGKQPGTVINNVNSQQTSMFAMDPERIREMRARLYESV